MSMLTPQGFKRKRYNEIFTSLERRVKDELGEDTNTSKRSFLGILLMVFAWFLSLFAQDLENTYNSNFTETSEGVSLDKNAKRQGAERQRALHAIGEIQVKGVPSVLVEAGLVVETKTRIQFETTESKRIDNNEMVIIPIRALVSGVDGNVDVGEITEIVNPQVGVNEVVNLTATKGGRNRETDQALKARLDRTKYEDNRLVYNLLNVDGVRDVYLDSNEEMTEVDGLPPKSIAPFVWGGDDIELAETIMIHKGGGVQSYGGTVVDVVDSKQRTHPIGFTRPTQKSIYINAILTVNDDFISYNEARTTLIQYVGGLDEDGIEYDGIGIGYDVINFKAKMAVGKLPGVDDVQMEFSTDGVTYTTNNIEIARNELAVTDWEKVVVS